MAYGFNPRLFVENGPAIRADEALARSSSVPFRAWKSFDRDRRLALVERALQVPANDDCDGLPIAL
ncbi:MAG: hypothetical protein ABIN68_01405 [Sphingomicrobium sp.]